MQSKAARRKWWRGLTSEQQQDYIGKQQAERTEMRRLHPVKQQIFPAITSKNRGQWLELIAKKNPWLNMDLITNSSFQYT